MAVIRNKRIRERLEFFIYSCSNGSLYIFKVIVVVIFEVQVIFRQIRVCMEFL